jgi:uncharacterized phage protein (TIGR01671 family)
MKREYQNREIKFRVWDKRQLEYLNTSAIAILCDGNGIVGYPQEPIIAGTGIGWCSIRDNGNESGYVFQQFTGLLDKNGREIYEGDIVSYSVRSIMDKDDSGHIEKSIVIYQSGYFGMSNYKYDDCQTMPLGFNIGILGGISKNYQCEIIGNIFENPE